jgi:hypothetical protein
MNSIKTNRTCPEGHTYRKSSDCPVCPICASLQAKPSDFAKHLSAPALRAFERLGITCLEDLQRFSPQDLLNAHGFGPSGFKVIEKLMRERGITFK